MDIQQGGWAWLALALVNAGLAEQKDRSRLVWFLLSLFIGPLATAYIVIAPRPEREPNATGDLRWTMWALAATLLCAAAVCVAMALSIPWMWFGVAVCVGLAALFGFVAWQDGRRGAS